MGAFISKSGFMCSNQSANSESKEAFSAIIYAHRLVVSTVLYHVIDVGVYTQSSRYEFVLSDMFALSLAIKSSAVEDDYVHHEETGLLC
jgi:hypothetical protein